MNIKKGLSIFAIHTATLGVTAPCQAEQAAPEAELTATKTDLTAAKAASEAQKATGEDNAALLKSGKLIAVGLTGGIAATASGGFGEARQTESTVGSLVYVLALPGYWLGPAIGRTRCASDWSGGAEEATKAAGAYARRSASRRLDTILAAIRSGATQSAIEGQWLNDVGVSIRSEAYKRAVAISAMTAGSDEQLVARRSWETMIGATEWAEHWEGANCLGHKFGVWVGRPLATYKADVMLGQQRERDVKPVGALGVGFSPNAYFTLLVGATISTAEKYDATTGGVVGRGNLWGWTVGIGGNLDLFAAAVQPSK